VEFGRDIRPIFEQTCYGCHSGSNPRGRLRLDVGALALKGGSSGPLLVPGNSGNSLLMARLRGAGGQPQMPMGTSLFDEEIAFVARWIDQGAEWPEAFEAASIKPTTTNPGTVASPDRFVRTGTLRQLVQYANALPPFQVTGGPDWVGSEVFDVNAKAAFVPTADEMRAMVRRLLTERFQLRTSAAKREMPIYFLRPARNDRNHSRLRGCGSRSPTQGRERPDPFRIWSPGPAPLHDVVIGPVSREWSGRSLSVERHEQRRTRGVARLVCRPAHRE
jgi:hypothetical protein